jgi:hypothetical protein
LEKKVYYIQQQFSFDAKRQTTRRPGRQQTFLSGPEMVTAGIRRKTRQKSYIAIKPAITTSASGIGLKWKWKEKK